MRIQKFIIIIIFIIMSFSGMTGQGFIPQSKEDTLKRDTSSIESDSLFEEIKLEAYTFSMSNIFDSLSIQDTVLNEFFPYFNPLDSFSTPLIEKGYIGSAAMPLTGYEPRAGFDLGYRQYDFYEKNMNNFKWYVSNVPMANLFFSPGGDVQQFWTTAVFSRSFKDMTLDIDYARMINEGKYKYQGIKHTALNVGIRQTDLSKRFITFFNFIVNTHQEQDNGGITDTSYFRQRAYDIRINIPVRLNDAVSRKDEYGLDLNGFYRLFQTGKIGGYTPYLAGHISTKKGFYKFYDRDVSGDSALYRRLWVDIAGLRNYTSYNSTYVSLSLFAKGTERKDFLNIGAKYGIYSYDQDMIYEATEHAYSYFAKMNKYFLSESINFNLDAEKYFLDLSSYQVKAKLRYANNIFSVYAGAISGSYLPPLKAGRMIISKIQLFDNEFENTHLSGYDAGLSLPYLGLAFQYKKEKKSGYIYYNEELMPVQYHNDINLTIFHLREKLKLWIVNLHGDFYKYNTDVDIIAVPEYVAKTKLFITLEHLYGGSLLLNTGFEYNYWSEYRAYAYNPAIADFYIQDDTVMPSYKRLDYFVSGKIKSFLFFIRFNNILFPFDKNIQFKVKDYPQPDLFWRLGVKWTLLN